MNAKNFYLQIGAIQRNFVNLAFQIMYSRQFRKYLKLNGFPNRFAPGEDKYLDKWKVFGHNVEPYSYRLFSHYMEACPDIVPENIGRSYIEPVLNPEPMRAYYEDKNMFPFICGRETVPETIIARMNGGVLLDGDLLPLKNELKEYLKGHSRLILKPSVGSSSGRGVKLFIEENGDWFSKDDRAKLTNDLLMSYDKDFILQVAVNQHKDMAVFNPSSVNTLRLAVYRSWKDEEPHVVASIMRVGKNGQFVDNAHAGGMFVGVDVATGQVGHTLFDQYGAGRTKWNGLDYSEERFIPNWSDAKDFACEVARKITHHRLLAMDITINSDGKPQLIEYNLRGFSYWLFMFTNQKPLGEYTDEIIEYCKVHKNEATRVNVMF